MDKEYTEQEAPGGCKIRIFNAETGDFEIRDSKDRMLLKPHDNGGWIIGRYDDLEQEAVEYLKGVAIAMGSQGVVDHQNNPIGTEEISDFLGYQEEQDEFCG